MTAKPKATKNSAKNIETPKLKRIDIPEGAMTEITCMNANLQIYIAGVVAGMDITGKWSFELKSKQIVVEGK